MRACYEELLDWTSYQHESLSKLYGAIDLMQWIVEVIILNGSEK